MNEVPESRPARNPKGPRGKNTRSPGMKEAFRSGRLDP